jgi:zinc transporter 1
MLTLT